jgi:hypothetical protein
MPNRGPLNGLGKGPWFLLSIKKKLQEQRPPKAGASGAAFGGSY